MSGETGPAGVLGVLRTELSHRGPDDRGEFVDEDGGIGLAHTRLSIIDLTSAGHQPMVAQDAGVAMTFNGELYNFRDLRVELERLGHVFRSRADSEVALRSFAQWGSGCFRRFCGMFAVAFWSKPERRLYLARDPMGMKPLYYWESARGLVFASEIKAFLAVPDFVARIDRVALRQFIEFGYCFDESRTILEGVAKVPAGTWLAVEGGRVVRRERYYRAPSIISGGQPGKEAVDALHETLSAVVSQHLVADVPVGLLLSGGLDSSVIAALAARQQKVLTISMGFSQSGIDERPHARAVAEFIGSEHMEVQIEPEEIVEDLAQTVRTFDDLFADWGTLSTRLLYQRCRERGIKVVLVGEGADELFGGYPVFAASQELSGPMSWRLFQLYRRYASRRYGMGYVQYAGVMRKYLKQTGNDLFAAVRLFESRRQLPNNYVMKVDKASMSVSVEARAPYLDRRVADLAYATPASALLKDGQNKALLREMAQRHALLPSVTFNRPKYGASMANSWMDEVPVMRDYARQVILDPRGWTDELGLRPAMQSYFEGRSGFSFPRALSIFGHLAWRLLLLNLWSRHYLPNSA